MGVVFLISVVGGWVRVDMKDVKGLKFGYWFMWMFFVAIAILAVDNAEAQVCVTPTENYNQTGSVLFCDGTYYLNDTDNNGVFWANTSNVIIQCNGTVFDGDLGTGSIAFRAAGSTSNITVKDCTFKDYSSGAKVTSYNGVYMINNTFINNSAHGLEWSGQVKNSQFVNNTFDNSSVYVQANKLGNFTGNIWKNCGLRYCGSADQYNIYVFSLAENISITNNSFDKARVGLQLGGIGGLGNITVENNFFQRSDVAIRYGTVKTSGYNNIRYNYFRNNTYGNDGYNLVLDAYDSDSLNFDSNIIVEQTDGILNIQAVNNSNITNNYMWLLCIENRTDYIGNGQNEPCFYIKVGKYFKTWKYASLKDNKNDIILNNTMNGDGSVMLFMEGAFNITHDLTDYWYKAIEFYNYSSNKSEFYVKNAYNEIRNNIRGFNLTSRSSNFYYGVGVGSTTYNITYYGLNKTHLLVWNDANNLTSIIIYNSSSTERDLYDVNASRFLAADISTYNFSTTATSTQFLYKLFDGGCDTIPSNNIVIQPSTTLCNGTGIYGNISNITINMSGLSGFVNKSGATLNLTYLNYNGKLAYFGSNSTTMLTNLLGMSTPYNDINISNGTIVENVTTYSATLTSGLTLIVGAYSYVASLTTTQEECYTVLDKTSALISSITLLVILASVFALLLFTGKIEFDKEIITAFIVGFIIVMIAIVVGVEIIGGICINTI